MGSLTYFQAVILGLVQGLAEFLPISSSGHLAIIQHFFGIEEDSVLFFAVMLHIGTLASVFVVYWKDIFRLIFELCYTFKDIFTGKGPRINANSTRRMGFMIIVATIPTAIMGLLFNDLFDSFYSNLVAIAVGLLITGTLLLIAEKISDNRKDVKDMRFHHAVFIGIMQGFAITPGISRSGSTLFAGLLSGLNRKLAVKFAFLVSIPPIIGSVIVELPDAIKEGIPDGTVGPMILGIIVAAVSGFLAIKGMIKVVSAKRLLVFSLYTWAIGIALLFYCIIT